MRDWSVMSAEDFLEEERWFADRSRAEERRERAFQRRCGLFGFVYQDDEPSIESHFDREREDREQR